MSELRICLESRYRKLQRGIPQTIFFCPECKGHHRRRRGCARCEGFGKLTRTSVQELIARRAVPTFRAKKGLFHGAGREDIDVLMLGDGRPFVFELRGVRNPEVDLEALREEIVERSEGAIELAPFEVVERDRIAYWKELKAEKRYRVRAAAAGDQSFPDDAVARLEGWSATVIQRTPERVAHRRADLQRDRKIAVESVRPTDDGTLELDIRCQHGTYVKEWVSGDGGRSTPSVSDLLGAPATCAQLDVLAILPAQGKRA